MKRSIVQQGPTTLMVSLPIKWVRKYNLSKGGELELEEQGRCLKISTSKSLKGAKKEIKISSVNGVYIWRVLQPLYILGYDEIKINFTDIKTFNKIQEFVLSSLIGYEIVQQERTFCVIKSVLTEMENNFPDILKRTFQNILRMSDITIDHLENKAEMSPILNLELTNNRHTMFLKRILTKEGFEEPKKIPATYTLVSLLEGLANEYKYFTWKTSKSKINIPKNLLTTYKKIHKAVNAVYDVYYNYDEDKAEEIITKYIDPKQIKSLFDISPEVVHYFMKIIEIIRHILYQVMILRMGN